MPKVKAWNKMRGQALPPSPCGEGSRLGKVLKK